MSETWNNTPEPWEVTPYAKRTSHDTRFIDDTRFPEDLIKRIVDMKKKQWFLIEIAEVLNDEGYRTFRNGKHSTVSIWKICYSKQAKKYWEENNES